MYVTRNLEWKAFKNLAKALATYKIHPSDTLMVIVSPDYSSSIGMMMAHRLSKDGEMLDIAFIDVPYPDENVNTYLGKFMTNGSLQKYSRYKQVILIEAGVISGKNYTWITKALDDHNIKYITAALFEHEDSTYKSAAVGIYYDSELEFYWEKYNNHWK